MYFELKQTARTLFSADFEIIVDETLIGKAHVEGKLASHNYVIDGVLYSERFSLHVDKQPALYGIENCNRSYTLSINRIPCGSVYLSRCKDGLFNYFCIYKLMLRDKQYEMYPIGMGKEGTKNPIYLGDRQIALIEKECVVIDDLHIYKIICTDSAHMLVSLIFSLYMYLICAFRPGEMAIKSVHKSITVTTSKRLKSKYDPKFRERFMNN